MIDPLSVALYVAAGEIICGLLVTLRLAVYRKDRPRPGRLFGWPIGMPWLLLSSSYTPEGQRLLAVLWFLALLTVATGFWIVKLWGAAQPL